MPADEFPRHGEHPLPDVPGQISRLLAVWAYAARPFDMP